MDDDTRIAELVESVNKPLFMQFSHGSLEQIVIALKSLERAAHEDSMRNQDNDYYRSKWLTIMALLRAATEALCDMKYGER